MTDDVAALVKAIVDRGEWFAVGPLADKLQELGRDKEAALLKRREAMWAKKSGRVQLEVAIAMANVQSLTGRKPDAGILNRLAKQKRDRHDKAFKAYLRSRFLPKRKTARPRPHICQRPRTCTCTCSVSGLEPSDDCPQHAGGEWPPRCGDCGRLMPHLATA
jgi:hypothetical protein